MANTGVTTFNEVAAALEGSPNIYGKKLVEGIRRIDTSIPYVYDAMAAAIANTGSYPDASTLFYSMLALNMVLARRGNTNG